ncbi:hypothetical protein ACRDU6_31110 [Mycolicibacterium sp. ELW1]|uniref:hypothetical protein n=1 Tax=Mycobacteriaceae TaxID=1762 RepID=UPI0011EC7F40|nr:hypothetical protein [Mycobacterium sp. ELW1]QEN16534.1 hypothetical protein D3H54_27625 [Mycobacterium sp. ELW1]
MSTQLPSLLIAAAAVASPVLVLSVGAPSAIADEPSCSFELTAPQRTTLPGTNGTVAVTATVRAVKCTGLAEATDAVVCINTPAGSQQCNRSPAWSTAQVYVTTGLNGTFTAQGKGCWGVFEHADCRDLGTVNANL